jgi:tetratricopeptide (TPR) repeat protein
MSISTMLKNAENLMYRMEFDQARQLYERIIQQDSKNLKALGGLAEALLELGDTETAKKALLRAIEIEPNQGAAKYLTLAQLLEGLEAITCYQKGLSILITQRGKAVAEQGENSEKVKKLNQQIATAFCAAAEIYLTDACFEENAETQCLNLLTEALKYDESNYEVLQTMASFRLSQSNPTEAETCLNRSYASWKSLPVEEFPSYEFRVSTAKLYLELSKHDQAREILEGLVAEHDSVGEVWYLLYLACQPTNPTLAHEHLLQAQEVLEEAITEGEAGEAEVDLKEEVDALVRELGISQPQPLTDLDAPPNPPDAPSDAGSTSTPTSMDMGYT